MKPYDAGESLPKRWNSRIFGSPGRLRCPVIVVVGLSFQNAINQQESLLINAKKLGTGWPIFMRTGIKRKASCNPGGMQFG